jgi:hypothetical protein
MNNLTKLALACCLLGLNTIYGAPPISPAALAPIPRVTQVTTGGSSRGSPYSRSQAQELNMLKPGFKLAWKLGGFSWQELDSPIENWDKVKTEFNNLKSPKPSKLGQVLPGKRDFQIQVAYLDPRQEGNLPTNFRKQALEDNYKSDASSETLDLSAKCKENKVEGERIILFLDGNYTRTAVVFNNRNDALGSKISSKGQTMSASTWLEEVFGRKYDRFQGVINKFADNIKDVRKQVQKGNVPEMGIRKTDKAHCLMVKAGTKVLELPFSDGVELLLYLTLLGFNVSEQTDTGVMAKLIDGRVVTLLVDKDTRSIKLTEPKIDLITPARIGSGWFGGLPGTSRVSDWAAGGVRSIYLVDTARSLKQVLKPEDLRLEWAKWLEVAAKCNYLDKFPQKDAKDITLYPKIQVGYLYPEDEMQLPSNYKAEALQYAYNSPIPLGLVRNYTSRANRFRRLVIFSDWYLGRTVIASTNSISSVKEVKLQEQITDLWKDMKRIYGQEGVYGGFNANFEAKLDTLTTLKELGPQKVDISYGSSESEYKLTIPVQIPFAGNYFPFSSGVELLLYLTLLGVDAKEFEDIELLQEIDELLAKNDKVTLNLEALSGKKTLKDALYMRQPTIAQPAPSSPTIVPEAKPEPVEKKLVEPKPVAQVAEVTMPLIASVEESEPVNQKAEVPVSATIQEPEPALSSAEPSPAVTGQEKLQEPASKELTESMPGKETEQEPAPMAEVEKSFS